LLVLIVECSVWALLIVVYKIMFYLSALSPFGEFRVHTFIN
jgi:hypothetical protein